MPALRRGTLELRAFPCEWCADATNVPHALTASARRRGYAVGPALAIAVEGNASTPGVLSRHLGLPETDVPSDPDLIVRFVGSDPPAGDLRLLGDDAGFDEERFLVLGRQAGGARASAIGLGEPLELTSPSAARALPLLVPLLDLAALRKGVLPVHGAVFSFEQRGIAVLGWPHAGKTSALLAFLARGASVVADDRAYVTLEPPHVAGLRAPIELRGHHLPALSRLSRPPALRTRAQLRLNLEAARLHARAVERPSPTRLSRLARRAAGFVADASVATVAPERLFEDEGSADIERLDAVFLMLRQLRGPTRVERLTVDAAGERLLSLARHDRSTLRDLTQKYRFAFPGRSDRLLDELEGVEARQIALLAGNVPAFLVSHTADSAPDLFDAMARTWR